MQGRTMKRGLAIGIGAILIVAGVVGFLCPTRVMSREYARWNMARAEAKANGADPDAIPKPDRRYVASSYPYIIETALVIGGIACLFWKPVKEPRRTASEPPPAN